MLRRNKREMNINKNIKHYLHALSNRAEVFNLIGQNDKALKDAKHNLKISRRMNDNQILAQAYELMSFVYDKTSQYGKMKKNAEKALNIYEKLDNKSGMSAIMGYLGDYHMYRGETDSAFKFYNRAIEISKDLKDLKNEADNATNMGIIYSDFLNDYKRALKYHKISLNLAKKIKDKQIEGAALNNIANVFQAESQLDKAIEFNHMSLEIIERIGDKEGIATILNNIQGKFRIALKAFHRSLNIRKEIGDIRGVGISLNNLGFVYEDMNDKGNAIKYYLDALRVRKSINEKYGVASTLNNIGNYYKNIDNYKKALRYCVES